MHTIYKVVRPVDIPPHTRLVSAHARYNWCTTYPIGEWAFAPHNSLLFGFKSLRAARGWRATRGSSLGCQIWEAETDTAPVVLERVVYDADPLHLRAFWAGYNNGVTCVPLTMETPYDTVLAPRIRLVRYID